MESAIEQRPENHSTPLIVGALVLGYALGSKGWEQIRPIGMRLLRDIGTLLAGDIGETLRAKNSGVISDLTRHSG